MCPGAPPFAFTMVLPLSPAKLGKGDQLDSIEESGSGSAGSSAQRMLIGVGCWGGGPARNAEGGGDRRNM